MKILLLAALCRYQRVKLDRKGKKKQKATSGELLAALAHFRFAASRARGSGAAGRVSLAALSTSPAVTSPPAHSKCNRAGT